MAEEQDRFRDLNRLIATLEEAEDDELDCTASTAMLPEFHADVHLGQQDRPQWRPLLRHLRTCPSCSRQLTLLAELDGFALGDAGMEPDRYPAQSPMFPASLPNEQAQARSNEMQFWRVDRWGRIIIELSRQALLGRYDLPASPGGQPAPGVAENRVTFAWEKIVDGVGISLDIRPSLTVVGHVDLSVSIAIAGPDGGSGRGGARVTVSQGDTGLASTMTDEDGIVVALVPAEALDQLLVEIDPASSAPPL